MQKTLIINRRLSNMNPTETNTLLLGTSNPLVHMALDLCKEYHADQVENQSESEG